MNADLRARILAEAKRTPSPTRADHQKRAAMVVAVGAALATALFFAMGGFRQGTRPIELVAFAGGYALVTAVVLTRLSGGRPRSMLPRPSVALVTLCLAAAPVLALGVVVASAMWPASASEEVSTRADVTCTAMTLAQGVLPLLVLLVLRRGTDPVHPMLGAAAIGMTAGAWTATMAYLRCPHAAASHCVIAHVAPAFVFAAASAVLGRALLSARR